MEALLLSRIQFALTIAFHYIYPPFTIGLSILLVMMEGAYLITRKSIYLTMAKFWVKIFALIFTIGVATGLVMEFQFGTNWATYSLFVGDVFGSPLAAEGVFAFFLESGFLAILFFGWNKIKPWGHFLSTVEEKTFSQYVYAQCFCGHRFSAADSQSGGVDFSRGGKTALDCLWFVTYIGSHF